MFWKKDPPPIYVEAAHEEARHAYRVEPQAHSPIALLVCGEPARIRNISSTGIAFTLDNDGEPLFDGAQPIDAVIFIGGHQRHPVPVELTLVDQQGNFYRCRLVPQSPQAEKAISGYIIEHQKREIRRRQMASPAPEHS